MSELQTAPIKQFLGVNKSATETQLQVGEASDMLNFMVTNDLKIQKMYGYEHLNTADDHPIKGMWYGSLNGTYHFLFAKNGHIYEHNLTTHADTDKGALTDALTTFLVSNNTVYIMNGVELYSWSGTGNIAVVAGYSPTVFTAAPPTGGGTILEGINYLTGKKTQKFSADGAATVYQLAELDIDSVDSVYVDGVLKTVTTDYAVDLTNGTVTFVTFPAEGVNNVVITWTKTDAADRPTITKNMYYGGVYYARYWIFGNPDHKNTRYCSGVTINGVSDPTYWPKFTESDVGDYEITDIETQYNQQIIFTSGDSSGASAWYSIEQDYTDPTTGAVTALFPVYPINAKIGNLAKGQVQIIYNNPFSLWKGVYEWVSTVVMNEKNAQWISGKVQPDLDEVDLSTALTADWDDKGQYWLCVGKKVWVYNYRENMKVWHILELAHTPTCFAIIDGQMCFGTDDGQIMRFDEDLTTYDGETISATWEMGFYDFGAEWLQKFIRQLFVSMRPGGRSHLDITYQTDKSGYSPTNTAGYNMATFKNCNFADYSFKTNYNPQPFRFKIRAKKIAFFRLILTNDGTDGATLLSLTLPFRVGGMVKRRN